MRTPLQKVYRARERRDASSYTNLNDTPPDTNAQLAQPKCIAAATVPDLLSSKVQFAASTPHKHKHKPSSVLHTPPPCANAQE